VRRGRDLGGGVRSGAAPRGEEAGEGPDPTGKQRTAGNGPTVVRTGGTQIGEDGALTRGPGGHSAGRRCQIRFETKFQMNSNQFQRLASFDQSK
jgi:hypothetical protein